MTIVIMKQVVWKIQNLETSELLIRAADLATMAKRTALSISVMPFFRIGLLCSNLYFRIRSIVTNVRHHLLKEARVSTSWNLLETHIIQYC